MSADSPEDNAQTRTLRILALAFGPAAVIFGLLVMPSLLTQIDYLGAWWTIAALLATVGVPVVLAILAVRLPARWIRWIAGCDAALFLLVFALLIPALGERSIPDAASPWILGICAIPTTIAALAWRSWLVWANIAAVAVLTSLVRIAASDQDTTVVALQDGLYTLMFGAVLASLALVAVRSSSLLDRVADAARAEAVTAAATQSRAHERERIGALIHDHVLTTLIAGSRAENGDARDLAAAQALTAIAELENLESGTVSDLPIPARELGWALQAMTTKLAPDTFYSEEVLDDVALDRTIVAAVSEAATEAIRNSVVHASRPESTTNRAVHFRAESRMVEVTILDDGQGFNRAAVPRSRLGITTSIIGRLRNVGGEAIVFSKVGEGTRVELSWRHPDA